MNKLMKLLLGIAMVGTLVGVVEAAPGVRGAKTKSTINFSATAVRVCLGPGAVYSIVMSTGATTEFAVLRDSNTANTSSSPSLMSVAATTSATQLTFDPPVQFRNGISFNAAATLPYATLTYECGVVNQAY